MSKRTKYSGEEKYIILQDYDCGNESISQIIKKYDIAEKRLEWHIKNTKENSLYVDELERLKAKRSSL